MGSNKSKKILIVFGTRPEIIKMAPVIKELKKYPRFKVSICVTAQHRELLDDLLKLFEIEPHYDLNIMRKNQSLFEVTTKSLMRIKRVLGGENPDLVVVQGDTTTAFAISLAAFYLKIAVAHIEAGLRTGDKYKPFPEEVNRRLISSLADLHFAPTQKAKENLLKEGINEKNIYVTGNTVIDALLWVLNKIKKNQKKINLNFSFLKPKSKKLILVTAHRRESFGIPLKNICLALKKLVERNKDIMIVYPVHPNPNVRETVKKILAKINRIELISPLDYAPFVYIMSKAYLILTDSGGIQEEASSLGKPVLVMRDTTERQEAIEAGVSELIGTDTEKIVRSVEALLDDEEKYKNMARKCRPFGDGKAARKIVNILEGKI